MLKNKLIKKKKKWKKLLNHQFEALRIINPPSEIAEQSTEPPMSQEAVQIAHLVVELLQPQIRLPMEIRVGLKPVLAGPDGPGFY